MGERQGIPDAGKLVELAAICEAAAPDRELDLEIHHQRQRRRYRWAEFGGLHEQDTIAVEEPPAFVARMIEEQGHVPRSLWEPDILSIPRYTASLDAAMTLVPEGYRIAGFFEDAADEAWKVNLGIRNGRFGKRGEQAYGRTPALALCAAALRARAASPERATEGEGK